MMGCTPWARAASKNLIAPKRLPASVIARAGMPSAAAAATASSTRAIPSTIEYSVWRRRWTKRGAGIARSILLAPLREKRLQQSAAFLGEDPALEGGVVVEPFHRRQVDHAPASPGLGVGRAEDDSRDAGVQHGAHAHGAGLERHVELATGEPVVAQAGGRLAQGDDLGVGGGIGGADRPVPPAPDDLAVLDDDGADRNLPVSRGLFGEAQRFAHERHSHSIVAGGFE